MECNLCQSDGGTNRVRVREMTFGIRGLFSYTICPKCESLQLIDIPPSQFSGSEKYLTNVPSNESTVVFGKRQVKSWDRRAKALNRISRGDQIMPVSSYVTPSRVWRVQGTFA
jgi:hypothetical protein